MICCGRADDLDDIIGIGWVWLGPRMGRVILLSLRTVSTLNDHLYLVMGKQVNRNIHGSVFKQKLDVFKCIDGLLGIFANHYSLLDMNDSLLSSECTEDECRARHCRFGEDSLRLKARKKGGCDFEGSWSFRGHGWMGT